MKSFLRENLTIAFGLGLPLLLVVVFLVFSGIPALLVEPPQYDVLYATEYNNYQSGVKISVLNQNVQVVYQGSALGHHTPVTGSCINASALFTPFFTILSRCDSMCFT